MAQKKASMTPIRHRSAWIWLAIAAMAVATLARAQAGIQSATAYTHPVLEFLGAHGDASAATVGGPRMLLRTSRQTRAVLFSGAGPRAWNAILPVLFIGLVAPLSLIPAKGAQCVGRAPSAPLLPFRFQRPPPQLLF